MLETWLKANGLKDSSNRSIFLGYFGLDNNRPIRILKINMDDSTLEASLVLRTGQVIIFELDIYQIKFYIDNTLIQPELSISFESSFLEEDIYFNSDLTPQENLKEIYWNTDVMLTNNIKRANIVLSQVSYDKIYVPLT